MCKSLRHLMEPSSCVSSHTTWGSNSPMFGTPDPYLQESSPGGLRQTKRCYVLSCCQFRQILLLLLLCSSQQNGLLLKQCSEIHKQRNETDTCSKTNFNTITSWQLQMIYFSFNNSTFNININVFAWKLYTTITQEHHFYFSISECNFKELYHSHHDTPCRSRWKVRSAEHHLPGRVGVFVQAPQLHKSINGWCGYTCRPPLPPRTSLHTHLRLGQAGRQGQLWTWSPYYLLPYHLDVLFNAQVWINGWQMDG